MKSITRLLKKISVLFFLFLCAEAFSKTDFDLLSFRSVNSSVFSHDESEFILSIPAVEPSKVQVDLPTFPADVKFVSSKKESDGGGGTLIHLWLYFSATGQFEIPPVAIRSGFKVNYVTFERISVSENPALVTPRLLVDFDFGRTVYAGESVFFTVQAQYAKEILSFDFRLPKDSILMEKERFFKKNAAKNEFSAEKIPLAAFEWKILSPGKIEFPEIFIDAISFNGNRRRVSLPAREIVVEEKIASAEESPSPLATFYDSAEPSTAVSPAQENSGDFAIFPREDCDRLHQLRTYERHAFPLSKEFSKKRDERIALEKSMGIFLSENEPNYFLVTLLFALAAIFFAIIVFLVIRRKLKASVLFFVAFFVSLCLSFLYEMDFSKRFGIFYGGTVFVIPENLSKNSGRFIPSGFRVKIVEKTSEWVYIETPDCSGWINSSFVKELD